MEHHKHEIVQLPQIEKMDVAKMMTVTIILFWLFNFFGVVKRTEVMTIIYLSKYSYPVSSVYVIKKKA